MSVNVGSVAREDRILLQLVNDTLQSTHDLAAPYKRTSMAAGLQRVVEHETMNRIKLKIDKHRRCRAESYRDRCTNPK